MDNFVHPIAPLRTRSPTFIGFSGAKRRALAPLRTLPPPTPPFFGGKGQITSTVKVHGTSDLPAQRRVGLYSCASRQLVRLTWSDPVTGAYAFSGVATGEPFFVVSWDHTGVFDAVVHDRIFASLP